MTTRKSTTSWLNRSPQTQHLPKKCCRRSCRCVIRIDSVAPAPGSTLGDWSVTLSTLIMLFTKASCLGACGFRQNTEVGREGGGCNSRGLVNSGVEEGIFSFSWHQARPARPSCARQTSTAAASRCSWRRPPRLSAFAAPPSERPPHLPLPRTPRGRFCSPP